MTSNRAVGYLILLPLAWGNHVLWSLTQLNLLKDDSFGRCYNEISNLEEVESLYKEFVTNDVCVSPPSTAKIIDDIEDFVML